ncbi:hypothetical protein D3C80_1515540 [compost metagenome]
MPYQHNIIQQRDQLHHHFIQLRRIRNIRVGYAGQARNKRRNRCSGLDIGPIYPGNRPVFFYNGKANLDDLTHRLGSRSFKIKHGKFHCKFYSLSLETPYQHNRSYVKRRCKPLVQVDASPK